MRVAAAALNVAPATAHRWWHRWLAASEDERSSRSCLATRRPVPRSCPWALSADQQQAILTAREKTNWGPIRLTYLTGRHRSTVWKGARPPRPLAPAARLRAPELAPLRVGRGWRAVAHRRLLGAQVRRARALGDWRSLQGRTPGRRGKTVVSGSATTTPVSPTASCTQPRTPTTSRSRCDAPRPGFEHKAAGLSKR